MIDKDELFNMQTPPDNIVCKTCKFKLQPVIVMGEKVERHTYGTCLLWENKPQEIFWKGAKCDFYRPE